MMNSIEIRKEATKFLEHQIYDRCSKKSLSKFTQVNLPEHSKNLLKVVMNAIYFGDQLGALKTIDLSEASELLSTFQNKVSASEMELIQYLSIVLEASRAS